MAKSTQLSTIYLNWLFKNGQPYNRPHDRLWVGLLYNPPSETGGIAEIYYEGYQRPELFLTAPYLYGNSCTVGSQRDIIFPVVSYANEYLDNEMVSAVGVFDDPVSHDNLLFYGLLNKAYELRSGFQYLFPAALFIIREY